MADLNIKLLLGSKTNFDGLTTKPSGSVYFIQNSGTDGRIKFVTRSGTVVDVNAERAVADADGHDIQTSYLNYIISSGNTLQGYNMKQGVLGGAVNIINSNDLSGAQTDASTYTITSKVNGVADSLALPSATTSKAGLLSATTQSIAGVKSFTNTTAAAGGSSPTGAVKVSGGVYIGNNLVTKNGADVGGTLNVIGAAALKSTLSVTGNATFSGAVGVAGAASFNNATDSTKLETGSVIIKGGTSVTKQLRVGGNVTGSGNATFSGNGTFSGSGTFGSLKSNATLEVTTTSTLKGAVTISDTTTATESGTTGALTVAGGAYIGDDLRVKDSLFVATIKAANVSASSSLSSGNTLSVAGVATFSNTTDSDATTKGAVVVTGGVGIGAQLRVKGAITGSSSITTSGAGSFNSVKSTKTLEVGTTSTLKGVVSITDTTAAAKDATTGALKVTGGAYVGNNLRVVGSIFTTALEAPTITASTALVSSGTLNVAGVATFSNSADSTELGKGAVVVTNGASVGKQLRVGGAITGSSSITISGAGTFNSVTSNTTLTVKTTSSLQGEVSVTSGTDATAAGAGALKVTTGGAYVKKDIRAGGTIYSTTKVEAPIVNATTTLTSGGTLGVAGVASFNNTTEQSGTAAAVKVSGGLYVAKRARSKVVVIDDHVELTYDSTNKSLNFVFV